MVVPAVGIVIGNVMTAVVPQNEDCRGKVLITLTTNACSSSGLELPG